MRRTVLASADLSGDALNELKQWLGISRNDEDPNLITLLQASLDICESFTGQRPLEAEFEELAELDGSVARLATRPVKTMLGVDFVDQSGKRMLADQSTYSVTKLSDGTAQIEFTNGGIGGIVAVRFIAGTAAEWAGLPGALRHGIIRLAAFHYRERDSTKTLPPPASVTALWMPWRQMRLA